MAMTSSTTPTPRPVQASTATPAIRQATTAKPSRLGAVKRGRLDEAKRFFFYGPEGVGKSSLAMDAPNAIFIDTDRGNGHLDVARYVFRDEPGGHIPNSLDEVYAAIDDLIVSEHNFETLVIDTADSLEQKIHDHICRKAGVTKSGDKIDNVEDFGFGKGYKVAEVEWRSLLHRLDQLRLRRNVHIVFIGHSLVKTFKNPTGEDFDRYRAKLDDRAWGVIKEWCDVIGYVTFNDVALKARGATRARGHFAGDRKICLQHHAAWDGKCRIPLEDEVELRMESPWTPFATALSELRDANPDELRAKIEVELARLGDEFMKPDGTEAKAVAVRKAVANAVNDTGTLSKYLLNLKQSQTKEQTP